eukprot:NODE_4501_length_655_cov_196.567657_g3850_i0.p1 GENE.NODE_4501_length_655_cov_196.567657_g3850_i0~~NODE_4501_length_655_cov_196.567657_g3850_i0.p1  ORF type:complete len:159 (+),score=32.84 NODE_4501_length_655_cov_196.567657_g3850_i0:41-478(+)
MDPKHSTLKLTDRHGHHSGISGVRNQSPHYLSCGHFRFSGTSSLILSLQCFQAIFLRSVKRSTTAFRKSRDQPKGQVVRTFFHYNVVLLKRGGQECRPHGLMGQTYSHTTAAVARGWNGEGVIEGSLQDYKVSSLFAMDSKFVQG